MTFKILLIMACAAMAFASAPALAQEEAPQGATEDHSAHHGAPDTGAESDQAPGKGMMDQGGMMGGGMMGQGGMMGGGDTGGMMMNCPRMGGMMGGMMGSRGKKGYGMMASRPMMEARLAFIKADLEITEAQMPAWNAYADAVRAKHNSMQTMHEDMMKAKESGSALERMDARIKAMENVVESLKALKPATEALYAVLSDDQKKKADQLLGGQCGMM